jgi:hypothetical protein
MHRPEVISRVNLRVSQGIGVLTHLHLGAGILERFVSMLQHLSGVLTIATMHGKIGGHKLCLGGTAGIDDVRLTMFDKHSIFHGSSSLVNACEVLRTAITPPV